MLPPRGIAFVASWLSFLDEMLRFTGKGHALRRQKAWLLSIAGGREGGR